MTILDEYRLYLGAYYGVQAMDSYDLKVYVLKEIDDFIKNFLKNNKIANIEEEIAYVKDNVPLKTKLQDSLSKKALISGLYNHKWCPVRDSNPRPTD